MERKHAQACGVIQWCVGGSESALGPSGNYGQVLSISEEACIQQ